MLVTDRFVFIHLHKSGGTFVNECLLRFAPDAKEIQYHLPRHMAPQFAALPALGLVRNPWDYYVSWYSFQLQNLKDYPDRPPNQLYVVLSEGQKLGFEGTIHNMLNLGTENTYLDPLIAALPSEYQDFGLNIPGPALEPLRNSRRGFYSFLYHHMYDFDGASGELIIGKMEKLREDILAMFAKVGQPVSDEMRAHILNEAPANTTTHDHYTSYYTPALRDLVAERDAEIISKYDYRFGS